MKKIIPEILIFIGAMLIISQLWLYWQMAQEQLSFDPRFHRYDANTTTIFHVDFPSEWDYYSVQSFLGYVIGRYFFVIIGLLMLIIGFRMVLRNKWSGLQKWCGKNIKVLTQKQGLPNQKLEIADRFSIYIYGELDESASKKHKDLKFIELGPEAAKLPKEDFQIYNYYILKVNNDGVIVKCGKYKFEGPFTDAADIENWDEFLNQ